MNDRVMQFRVGVVVLATAIITGILIVLFGDLPSLVQATYPLKMSFTDARGVADGTPVRKNGILVGRVASGIGSAFAAAGSGRGVGFVRDESATMSVAFAAAGDVNLDGVVDILDVSALLADGGYDTATPADWATGDFTFDGVVDILDVSELFAAAAFDAGSYLPSGSLTRRRIR